ncbi:MAG: hypothetical protein JSV13_07550 [Nitrospiraceae bacterium]|nr:MAG: hypothetical protein JSV13_07550 [Nitrospiraceae bacterium]
MLPESCLVIEKRFQYRKAEHLTEWFEQPSGNSRAPKAFLLLLVKSMDTLIQLVDTDKFLLGMVK